MASNKLLQDTATLFVPLGENDDGIMQYGAYLLEKVFCRISAGTNMSKGSLSAGDTLTLFIFDGKSVMTQDGAAKTVATACERIFYVNLRNSGIRGTDVGSGRVIYNAPYASKCYYGHMNFSKAKHPQACRQWFEKAKAANKTKWIKGAKGMMKE